MRYRTFFYIFPALVLILLLSDFATRRVVDFPAYYDAVQAMRAGKVNLYGPNGALAMIYRYPPLFLLLFFPLALLPFKWAAILWTAPKFAVLYFLVRAMLLRLKVRNALVATLAFCPSAAYLALEFHYGNAQFYVFALVALGLLWLRTRPLPAALALALAISIKVWPLFFVPYGFAVGYRRVAGWTLISGGSCEPQRRPSCR